MKPEELPPLSIVPAAPLAPPGPGAGPSDPESGSGLLRVRPGAALPTIASTRREWAPTIGRGQPPERLPERLALLFNLCGGAHRIAAGHAVAAALGAKVSVTAAQREDLRADTLREHLRRLWLDAPRIGLSAVAPDPTELSRCPLVTPLAKARPDALDASRGWIDERVFGQPAADWLAGWVDDPAAHAVRWSAQGATWPARWLAAVREGAGTLQQRVASLSAHASSLEMQRLARRLHTEAGFALAPTWRGHTAETGCWTRLADRPAQGADNRYAPIWLRHAARVADIARLLAPEGQSWLAQGALAIDAGQGLGWCEMARGLLVHGVQLGSDGRVADNRLIAPTEWNFHPFGPAARALAMLPSRSGASLVRLLVAAYDPCVAVEIEPAPEDPDA